MQLMRKKSDGSFYESFSDLIFCALVLFVALVMVLAANVGAQVESLKNVKADLEESKNKLKSAVNSHRYTGASSTPSLSLAIDVRENEPRFFFTPRAYIDSLSTPNINETEEQALSRQRNAIIAITESMELQKGLTKVEFQTFLKAFSYHTTIPTEWPILGVEVEEIEKQMKIINVYPFSTIPADDLGAFILEVDGKKIQTLNDLRASLAGIEASKEYVSVVIEKNASRVDLEVKILRHFYDGITTHMIDTAHCVASGWRLVGEGLDMEKNANVSGNRDGRELTFEQTQLLAREVFGSLTLELGLKGSEDPVTVLQMRVLEAEQMLLIGGIALTLNEVLILLRSIANGNVAIEFVDEKQQPVSLIPEWVRTKLLNPAGYINRAPDLEAIKNSLDVNTVPKQAE